MPGHDESRQAPDEAAAFEQSEADVPATDAPSVVHAHAPPLAVDASLSASPNLADGPEAVSPEHKPTGLALRDAVLEASPQAPALQSQSPEEGIGAALLGELLAHQLAGGLKQPSDEAQARAKPYFDRWLHKSRALSSGEPPAGGIAEDRLDATTTEFTVHDVDSASQRFENVAQAVAEAPPGARHYPIAQRVFEQAGFARSTVEKEATGPEQTPAAPVVPPSAATRPRTAPQAFGPPQSAGPQPADIVPQDLLQQTSETALMWTEPSGGTCFRIDFADALFAGTACIITVKGQEVLASFYVGDVNARRLLSAESRRLQASLEARGLAHAQVRIVMGPPPAPHFDGSSDTTDAP